MAYTPSCMHACMDMALLQPLNILLLASMLVLGSAEEAPSGEELIHRPVARTDHRAAMLSATDGTNSPASSGTYPLEYNDYQYLMQLKIGTSRKEIWATADTGTDVVWTKRLDLCNLQTSSTFTHVDCSADMCHTCCYGHCMFEKKYGNGGRDFAIGFMGNEALALSRKTTGKINVPSKVFFGCAIDHSEKIVPEGADGIVGLNWGPMSLLQQLDVNKFSYCLSNQNSRLDLGLSTGGKGSSSLQTTGLVQVSGSSNLDNKYLVELEGISIGRRSIDEKHFKHKSTNDNGVIFVDTANAVIVVDTGTPRTVLESNVFREFKKLLGDELNSRPEAKEQKTCFRAARSEAKMVLYFKGAQMHLPWEKYMDLESAEEELFCLAIRESSSFSVLGSLQQQNTLMIYDLTKRKLSFEQNVNC